MSKRIATLLACTALIGTSACVTDPDTGERRVSRAAIGAGLGVAGGYLLGDLVGGRNDRTERIVGAGIGAYMDRQERQLREQTAGTGIEVTRNGNELVLNMPSGVTFAVDRYDIQPQFQSTLNEVAQTLAAYPSTYIDVYGHTDSTGSETYNQTLSQNRAQSVANYLSARGVNQARIATRGFGEMQPVASNETEQGRQANRRVEIRIVPVEQQG